MHIEIGPQVWWAIVFGLVFAGVPLLIARYPLWSWRWFVACAMVLAGLAYLILSGAIKVAV